MLERYGEWQRELGRVSHSPRGLAISMLTGRQPVYREKEKKHQGNPALVYPQLNYSLDPKMGRGREGCLDEEGGTWGGGNIL